ncbi:MAG: hypothetical protein WD342_17395 [Verrucomicrobiales bacterium]
MDERSGIERERRMREREAYEPLSLPILDAELETDRTDRGEHRPDHDEGGVFDTAGHASTDEN